MSYLKPISGYTSCKGVMRYLEKKQRAVARDFINLNHEKDDFLELTWAEQMDNTRIVFGNDSGKYGKFKRTRRYEHFVLSPNPKDNIDLETLRLIAKEWTENIYGDYECAIIYHIDSGVPHAHVVVNNTNLETGHRLSHKRNNKHLQYMKDSLNEITKSHGLRDFLESVEELEALQNELGEIKDVVAMSAEKTAQVKEIAEADKSYRQGKYSWKEDIKERVEAAFVGAKNFEDFQEMCLQRGISVEFTKDGEYMYVMVDQPSRRVSAPVLEENKSLTKDAIQKRFGVKDPPPIDKATTQTRHQTGKEKGILKDGKYSWKEDISERVEAAVAVSRTSGELVEALDRLGLGVRNNAKGNDFIYYIKGQESRQVSGNNLGKTYTKAEVQDVIANQRETTFRRTESLNAFGKITESQESKGLRIATIACIDPNTNLSIRDILLAKGLVDVAAPSHTGELATMSIGTYNALSKGAVKTEKAKTFAREVMDAYKTINTYKLLDDAPKDYVIGNNQGILSMNNKLKIYDADAVEVAARIAKRNKEKQQDFVDKGFSGRAGDLGTSPTKSKRPELTQSTGATKTESGKSKQIEI